MSASGPNPPTPPQVQSLNCPGCGGAITLRSLSLAVTVVCDHCHAILDAQDPRLTILQKFKAATSEDPPLIPLGSRGKIRGTLYEIIGFQRRTIKVDGVEYSWHEYVLFNPFRGFRYLTEYNGHWNDTSTLRSLPTVTERLGPPTVTYLGETYKHFQTCKARSTFVLGEFPWQVRVGEAASVSDYVSPPRVLSRETNDQEVSWSMGEYVSPADVWKAFSLSGSPPERIGIYENQPSPFGSQVTDIWFAFAGLAAALILLTLAFFATSPSRSVFTGGYQFDSRVHGEASFVTDNFQITGHTSDVELTTSTDLENRWIYLNYALINQDTGQAFDFGREVSYYHGYDEDGSWSEGSRDDTVVVPTVPAGNYYLRVEPEDDPGSPTISYSISIKRDVPQMNFLGIALAALLIPAGLFTWRSLNFEHQRWSESDYPPAEGQLSLGSLLGSGNSSSEDE